MPPGFRKLIYTSVSRLFLSPNFGRWMTVRLRARRFRGGSLSLSADGQLLVVFKGRSQDRQGTLLVANVLGEQLKVEAD